MPDAQAACPNGASVNYAECSGAGTTYSCDIVNGSSATGGGALKAVWDNTRTKCGADWCIWGTNYDGNLFCIEADLSSYTTFEVRGGVGVDAITLQDGAYTFKNPGGHGGTFMQTNVLGGDEVDYITGSSWASANYAESLSGEGGADVIDGDEGNDELDGGSGADALDGGNDNDTIRGGSDDDTIYGGSGDDSIYGDGGVDTIYGEDDADSLYGGPGADDLSGGYGDDVIRGDDGDDTLQGDQDDDTIHGGDDNDTIRGGAGVDTVYAGPGNDLVSGGIDNDVLHGDGDHDIVCGDDGDDELTGDLGNDTLWPGTTATIFDRIIGHGGTDTCEGFPAAWITSCEADLAGASSTNRPTSCPSP